MINDLPERYWLGSKDKRLLKATASKSKVASFGGGSLSFRGNITPKEHIRNQKNKALAYERWQAYLAKGEE